MPATQRPCCHLPRRAAPCRRAARGFTLVELLVALSVMALLAIVSWRGLDGMVRSQEQTRQRGSDLLVLQSALGQWGTDLDALVTLPGTVPLDWDGQVLRLTRRSSAVPDPGALVVGWTRRSVQGQNHWLRWQSPPLATRAEWQQAWQQAAQWARNPGEDARRLEVVLVPLADWQLFYFRGGAWTNPQSSTGSSDAGASAGGAGRPAASLPEGVRLQLDMAPGQALVCRITRDWVNPLKGGGKS